MQLPVFPLRSHRLFLRLLSVMILSIGLTTAVVSGILYMNYTRIASAQAYTDDLRSLSQTSRQVALMSRTVSTYTAQIFRDLSVSRLMYYQNSNVYDVSASMVQLGNFRQTMPFVDSVYVYNGSQQRFFSTSTSFQGFGIRPQQNKASFEDPAVAAMTDHFHDYDITMPIPRLFRFGSGTEATERSYYTFVMFDRLSGNALDAAVFVNLDADWIGGVIRDEQQVRSARTMIVDARGRLISTGSELPMMSDLSDLPYIREALSAGERSGYGIYDVSGIRSLVTYTGPDALGWHYLRVTPLSEVFGRIETMRRNTLLTGLGILLAGILLTLAVSRQLFAPFRKLINRVTSLEARDRDALRTLKSEFLRQLLSGMDTGNLNALNEKMSRLDVRFRPEDSLFMVLLRMDHAEEFARRFPADEQSLYRFAILNIASEMFASSGFAESVDMGSDAMVLMLRAENTPAACDFPGILRHIQLAVSTHLSLSVSASYLSSPLDPGDISQGFQMLSEALLLRLFLGHGCVIHAPVAEASSSYVYPLSREKQLLDALMLGRSDEASRLTRDILDETFAFSVSDFSLALSHLSFSVRETVDTLRRHSALSSVPDFPSLDIRTAETAGDIFSALDLLYARISEALREKRSNRHEDLIVQVQSIIASHFSDRDLSVESIADTLKMSMPYLCKIYKQYTQNTILDSIIDIRMHHARELLSSTSEPVSKISESVGFSDNSYFFRIFKKHHGVTPSEYRKKIHSEA